MAKASRRGPSVLSRTCIPHFKGTHALRPGRRCRSIYTLSPESSLFVGRLVLAKQFLSLVDVVQVNLLLFSRLLLLFQLAFVLFNFFFYQSVFLLLQHQLLDKHFTFVLLVLEVIHQLTVLFAQHLVLVFHFARDVLNQLEMVS